jgi:hypothetical protein
MSFLFLSYFIPVFLQFNSNIIPILVIGDELEMNWRCIGDVLEI